MEQWQRRRHPDDVPTPIAVAVADFCRRAKAPAPAAAVREALAILGDDDDFRVKELTDAEPSAKPLGPFALVDIVNGVEPKVAAQREQTGYYELVRQMAAKTEAPHKPVPAAAAKPPPAALRRTAEPSEDEEKEQRARRRAKRAEKTLAEKIAPKKRAPGSAPVAPAAKAELPSPFRKRDLPAPRGRFTRIEAEATRFDELLEPGSKDQVLELIHQSGNRVALQKTLERRYVVRRGVPPGAAEVEALLDKHKLQKVIERQERAAIISALVQHRGASSRVAREMGVNRFELEQLIERLSLGREVDEIRERYVREALSAHNLAARLELLGNPKYLADLKIVKRFKDALERDVLEALEALPVMSDVDTLTEAAARRYALNPESLRRVIDSLGIEAQLDFQPSA